VAKTVRHMTKADRKSAKELRQVRKDRETFWNPVPTSLRELI
jgi:hypothetical protein